jgi:signal transduction histidine kinase
MTDQRRRRLRPSFLSASVALILVAFSVGGFALTEHDNTRQEQTLLQNTTNVAAFAASQALNAIGSALGSLAAVVSATNGSPTSFEQTQIVKAFAGAGVVGLINVTTPSYTIAASSHNGFPTGTLDSTQETLIKRVANAHSSQYLAGPVSFDGKLTTARFAVAAQTASAKFVVYAQFTINPRQLTDTKAFSELNYLLYGAGPTTVHNLFVSSVSSLSLSGPVARAKVAVGGSNWTLIASAKHPFIGSYVHSLSIIILLLGLLIALIAGGTIEVLHRRHRYARALVEERTADLELSLINLEEAHQTLIRGERLTAIGEMAGVVGHELRNPLAAVTNALFLIRSQVAEPMTDLLARNLAMAERETAKAATLADDLTAFVRPREMDKKPIPVEGLVDEVLSVAPPPDGVELITEVEDFTLVADRGQMAEILTNLVTNAYEAIPGGGTLHIRAGHMPEGMRLIVEDTGPGIDESVAHRVTEPFFTTKYSGTGLGLAIVHRLVTAHGGSIEFANADGGGARVTVLIPDHADLVTT